MPIATPLDQEARSMYSRWLGSHRSQAKRDSCRRNIVKAWEAKKRKQIANKVNLSVDKLTVTIPQANLPDINQST